jgi:N-acetylglutamate synthase-like GNAT family acetyltransferase
MDASLQVATIHDLIIHPDLQGFGLGSTLLKRLVAQISDEDVWDVGTVTPGHLQPFFHTCSFELDREQSVPMALSRGWAAEVEQINQPLQANSKLAELLQQVTLDVRR